MVSLAREELFTEKYRPTTFDEYIFHDNEKIRGVVETALSNPFKIQHMILHSSAGTGKSTFAKALARMMNADYLEVDGSIYTSIDHVRGLMTEFARTMSSNPNAPKILFIEEGDGMSVQAQKAMKKFIENLSGVFRVIIATNDLYGIIEPIRSRCLKLNFGTPNKKAITDRIMAIARTENIDLSMDFLLDMIDNLYPDIRSMIITLDNYAVTGSTDYENISMIARALWDDILNGRGDEAEATAARRDIEHRAVLRTMYLCLKSDNRLSSRKKLPYVIEMDEGEFRMAMGSQHEIAFHATVARLLSIR